MEHCHNAFEQMRVVEMFQLQSVTAEVTGEEGGERRGGEERRGRGRGGEERRGRGGEGRGGCVHAVHAHVLKASTTSLKYQ